MAKTKTELREWISSGFTRVEDVAYVGLGLVLAVSVLVMLVTVALSLGQAIMSANLPKKIVALLDQSLLILRIVEILYTVQVSFREHTLVAEPFLIVGLIAAIRRVLILTAEFSKPAEISEVAFHNCDVRAGSFDGFNPRPGILTFFAEAATHRLRRSRMMGGLSGARRELSWLASDWKVYGREKPRPHCAHVEKSASIAVTVVAGGVNTYFIFDQVLWVCECSAAICRRWARR
jgi:uncharacterized membrane protein (DUF373 family)